VRETATGREIFSIPKANEPDSQIQLSGDGRICALTTFPRVRVFDVDARKALFECEVGWP